MIPTEPQFTPHGVQFPTPLAVAMMECYFGTGPRYRETRSPSTPPPPSPSTPPGEEQETLTRGLKHVNSVTEWIPKGVGARKPVPAPTAEVEGEVQSRGTS